MKNKIELAILVVDDSPSMRDFIEASLEDRFDDVVVVHAESGFTALRLLPSRPFAAVLTDINMPDINGLELIRYLKENENYRRIPTLIISTENTEADRKRGLALGADGYLIKPFTPDELCRAVSPYLKQNAP